jgi:hypothetical protein
MVRRTGFRIQDSGFSDLEPGVGNRGSSFALALLCFLFCSSLVPRHSSVLFGQQPQAQQGQPLYAANAKYVNGVAPGYWPTPGTGLTLNLSTGTALCGNPLAPVTYAGGTLTMTATATNYVYLDPLGSCVPTSNTSGFGVGQIPVAVVVTNASAITAVNDVRSFFSPPITLDSTGRSIFKGLNGTYLADQFGDKSTTGIASAISACDASTPCRVVVPGSYPTTEQVPGSFLNGYWQSFSNLNAGTTSSNVQVLDFRLGDYQTGINQQGGSIGHRPWHQWVDNIFTPAAAGTYQTHTLFNPVMNALDGGVLLSNGSYYTKSGNEAIEAVVNQYTPGDPSNNFVTNQYSVGDSVPVYALNTFYGGQSTEGEEGAEGVDIWVYQGNTAYQGTIASGGLAGATSLTLSPTAGAGTQGAMRYLINTTSGKTMSAGTISNITNNTSGGTPITFTGSGTSWSVSTVNTTTTQAITSPGVQTVTVGSSSGITTSTVLVICDASAYETVIPSAVGVNQITANFTAPHSSGALVAAGGLSGYFLELTADTVPSGTTGGTALRQAFPVLYSTSATSLVASIDEEGTWVAFIPGVNTAWTNASGSNGYVLYPGATVTSVFSSGAVGNTFSLMPNAVNWQNGDTVELPQHPADYASLGSWNVQTWWPAFGSTGGRISFFGVPGYETTGMRISNYAPTTLYSGGGGNLQPPYAALRDVGPWQVALDIQDYGPSINGMVFEGQKWGATGVVYPILAYPHSGNGDYLEYNSTSKSWTLSTNSQNGAYSFGDNVSGGGFTLPGHVGSNTSDSQGTVTITSSISATVDFSVAFQHAPICTLTPTSDPTSVGTYWVTSTNSSFTVNVHTSGTITFNYICMGNPN